MKDNNQITRKIEAVKCTNRKDLGYFTVLSVFTTAAILKFGKQGEKTGWTYIVVPASATKKLNPGVKRSYRVKGKLDELAIQKVALVPMGGGDFILAVNAGMRKVLCKRFGQMLLKENILKNCQV